MKTPLAKVCITGGCGFIGSHLVDACVARGIEVTVIDNLSSGKVEYITGHVRSGNVQFIKGSILDPYLAKTALASVDTVFHLAANPDARRGIEDPSVDLELEVVTTFQVLEMMRRQAGPRRIIFASSGTVYGDVGGLEVNEDFGPCQPISPYGAGKLAAEAFISAYAGSFGISGIVCRFGNVVGERATHGALFDFANRLKENLSVLPILGDGRQAKPYIYVRDIVDGLLFVAERADAQFDVFNMAPQGASTVEFLARVLLRELGLTDTMIETGNTPYGWIGDIPQSRMSGQKLAKLGWSPSYTSDQAVEVGVKAFAEDLKLTEPFRTLLRECRAGIDEADRERTSISSTVFVAAASGRRFPEDPEVLASGMERGDGRGAMRMVSRSIRGAVIGAGLIGRQRSHSFISVGDTCLKYVCDAERAAGIKLANEVAALQGQPCEWVQDYEALLTRDIDLAFVAVPHNIAAEIVMRLLENRINVLMEKPMGINVEEAQAIARIARDSKATLAVGFNYRHYPAIARAKQLVQQGVIGNVICVRMILGHGGRPGYEKEWKLSRAKCGGGVLFDPGVHLVDLGRFFLGELEPVQAHIATLHWSVDVEDIAVAIARNHQGAEFHLHTSLIEWENHFFVGIFGDGGYIKINGRMGNYGVQELVYGKKWAWLENGSQRERNVVEVFGNEDTSFSQETKLVVEAIRNGRPVPENHEDGLRATELVDQLYRMATVKP